MSGPIRTWMCKRFPSTCPATGTGATTVIQVPPDEKTDIRYEDLIDHIDLCINLCNEINDSYLYWPVDRRKVNSLYKKLHDIRNSVTTIYKGTGLEKQLESQFDRIGTQALRLANSSSRLNTHFRILSHEDTKHRSQIAHISNLVGKISDELYIINRAIHGAEEEEEEEAG